MLDSIDLSANAHLSFYATISYMSNSDGGIHVYASTDDGVTWELIDTVQNSSWELLTYDLSSYASSEFKLKFAADSDYIFAFMDEVLLTN